MEKNSPTTETAASKPRKRHRGRRWIPYLGALLLLAAIVAGLWPKPVPVETAKITIGRLRASVNEEGKTRVRQRYVVSAPVAGQLRRVPFKAGAEVSAGTVLALIDPPSPTPLDARARSLAEARRDTAAANLAQAQAALQFARSELGRFERLYAEQTISVQERETVQLREASAAKDLAAAESALRQAEAELKQFALGPSAQAQGGPVEVKSPVAGRVLRVLEENERSVVPGMPLMEVGDPRDLEVVIDVLSRDGASIGPGTPVEIEHWGGLENLWAKVRLVEPAAFTKVSALGVEEQRVNVIADLTTPAEQRASLGDGFRVEARIITWEADDVTKVPAGALFRKGENWAVFVLKDGRAHLRVIKSGKSGGSETQVLEGLSVGDTVILYPGNRIQEGARVTPIVI